MDGYPETTAIIGTSDLLMLGVYRGLLEMGLRVPDDISLVGTDDCWLSRSLPVSLTSIDMKTQQLASTAVKWFFDRIEGGDWNQPRRIVIDSGLVIRESTGKAKKH
jgi:DNA-binding LacI/PurR family transcriptional regulator